MNILPVKFDYCGNGYEALIRIKAKETKTEYCITVMNGELEKKLFGYHIMTEENGVLHTGSAPDAETASLKASIARALLPYIRTAHAV